MLKGLGTAIDGVARRLAYDAKKICNRVGSLADEDDFTSRLAQEIERSLDGRIIGGLYFKAYTKKMKWRAKSSEETVTGADLLLVLQISAGSFEVHKGFLIQAKMNVGSSDQIIVDNRSRLSAQIDEMMQTTSDAYVWAYAQDGIAVARAGSLKAALDQKREQEFEPMSFANFFRGAMRSHSGDYALRASSFDDMAELASKLRAKRLLHIRGVADEPPRRVYKVRPPPVRQG